MRTVGIRKLTMEAFAPYGVFASVTAPKGPKIGEKPVEFFRDMAQQSLGAGNIVSYSACAVKQRDWVITNAEYHNHCCEAIVCLDGDYLAHFAAACPEGEEPFDGIEVFLVPKGTLVVVRPGVWHQAGFPYGCGEVHILCALPERTYANDCVCMEIPESKRVRVEDRIID